eukprot:c24830_g1_i1 orf=1-408(-)
MINLGISRIAEIAMAKVPTNAKSTNAISNVDQSEATSNDELNLQSPQLSTSFMRRWKMRTLIQAIQSKQQQQQHGEENLIQKKQFLGDCGRTKAQQYHAHMSGKKERERPETDLLNLASPTNLGPSQVDTWPIGMV